MTDIHSLTERVRAFAHMAISGDHNVRNHLSISGPTRDVEAFVKHARMERNGVEELMLGNEHVPVTFEERRYRERSGAWMTMESGQEPKSRTLHEEESEAVFSFATSRSLEGELVPVSEEHPQLEFRYAWFEHRGDREDIARGGLWKGGRRVAEHIGQLKETPPDSEQLADLVRHVEALEEPATAVAPAS